MTVFEEDIDSIETQEWLDALSSMIQYEGVDRARFIIEQLLVHAQTAGVAISGGTGALQTPYVNSIPVAKEPAYPGDLALEAKIEAWVRWNAIAMVLLAKRDAGGVGGHLATFASIATLYEVGQNHFFRGETENQLSDFVYFQGHACEGNYARAYLEGRLSDDLLKHFRQEALRPGLSSYPHPWLMPDFWQFATVSLGLGVLQGIYQAHFQRYLANRGLVDTSGRKVWIFCGDGEMDEPESIAGLTLAARERLDNLIFVINCNLQRLDGLVRSNYKIIQELEGLFHGAGWHVLKVLWGSEWDAIFAKDKQGLLVKRLQECVDGDLQTAYARGGAYLREFLFGQSEELRAIVADLSDAELTALRRGGHDPVKIYAAYANAMEHRGQPTVILVQSVKGYGLGTTTAEGRNIAHNQLDMSEAELKAFRERFQLPLTDQQLLNYECVKPTIDSSELKYLHAKRQQLGGYLPHRSKAQLTIKVPALTAFEAILKGSQGREVSTTMVLGRILNVLLKDPELGRLVVPIFSDEVRTFGLEALFRQIGIYSPLGQLYIPEDKEQLAYYHEAKNGQMLEEGITEAGCMSAWLAAATSYSANRFPMLPIFTYYSMFGFQRVGDFIWAAGDMRARGFLIGATAGRTTLQGEGLQHQDGSSLLTAAMLPSCRAYDPAYGYEMAVVVQQGLQDMLHDQRDVFYYITAMNEKYVQPEMPKDVAAGIIKGMYLLKPGAGKGKLKVQLLGSGTILREVLAAAELLAADFGVLADVWSVTSFSELRREALALQRANMLTPEAKPELSYLEQCLQATLGPIVAATDYVKAYADLIRPWITRPYLTLGTDGYGRSDTREALRTFFEVNRYYIAYTALYALAKAGDIPFSKVAVAMRKYQINPNKPNPMTV